MACHVVFPTTLGPPASYHNLLSQEIPGGAPSEVDVPQRHVVVEHLVEPLAFGGIFEGGRHGAHVHLQDGLVAEDLVEVAHQLPVAPYFEQAGVREDVVVEAETLGRPRFDRFVAARRLDRAHVFCLPGAEVVRQLGGGEVRQSSLFYEVFEVAVHAGGVDEDLEQRNFYLMHLEH